MVRNSFFVLVCIQKWDILKEEVGVSEVEFVIGSIWIFEIVVVKSVVRTIIFFNFQLRVGLFFFLVYEHFPIFAILTLEISLKYVFQNVFQKLSSLTIFQKRNNAIYLPNFHVLRHIQKPFLKLSSQKQLILVIHIFKFYILVQNFKKNLELFKETIPLRCSFSLRRGITLSRLIQPLLLLSSCWFLRCWIKMKFVSVFLQKFFFWNSWSCRSNIGLFNFFN